MTENRPVSEPGPVTDNGDVRPPRGEDVAAAPDSATPGASGQGPAKQRALVVTASTRAAAGVYQDRSGPIIAETLARWGFLVAPIEVVPDGDTVGDALRTGVGEGFDLILTTGGTGLNPHDVTPQQTEPLLDVQVPQLMAQLARAGVDKGVPTAVLSRGLAGVAAGTLVINLPGSRGGVRDALDVLEGVLPHALSQIAGGDH